MSPKGFEHAHFKIWSPWGKLEDPRNTPRPKKALQTIFRMSDFVYLIPIASVYGIFPQIYIHLPLKATKCT